ncbi:methionyl-tRNA formyltransferase [Clostridia bacterium]|nr:methionyl-tRNA formyltransferase [Clostridia bacterium]
MKIVFMGTPTFAKSVFAEIMKNHEVVLAVTQPDKPLGRKRVITPPPVKEFALQEGIPVFQPEKIKKAENIAELRKANADIFVVAAYGQILSQEILDIPKFGCVNVHASLLPKYRGAAPIQHSIINGERETGVTIMRMDKGLDTGDMILSKAIIIEETDTAGTMFEKLAVLGGELLLSALTQIECGSAVYTKQDDSLSTYAPMINKETGLIDFNKDVQSIVNLVRGLAPFDTAYTRYQGEVIKIWEAKPYYKDFEARAGQVVEIDKKNGIIIKTFTDTICISEIQAQSSKRMDALAYARGHNIRVGDFFN